MEFTLAIATSYRKRCLKIIVDIVDEEEVCCVSKLIFGKYKRIE